MSPRIALLAAVVAIPTLTHASVYTYDFSALTPGSTPAANETPVPAGVSFQGTTTIGQVAAAQDNWVWTSSTGNVNGAIVRNDVRPGFSGNYLSGYTTASPASGTAAPSPYDSINSRKNSTTGGFTYSLPSDSIFRLSFVVSVEGFVYSTNTRSTSSRAEVAFGYDQNNDGDVRGDSANVENAEWGPTFGYEPAASTTSTTLGQVGKWYIRPPNLGTAVTADANGPGVYKIQIDIDPTANPTATPGVFDGAATFSVQQLFTSAGVAVDEALHPITGLTNVNLLLSRMNTTTAGGTAGGWNPANWNGLMTRVASNGAIDNIVIATGVDVPEPASAALALPALALLTRRRR